MLFTSRESRGGEEGSTWELAFEIRLAHLVATRFRLPREEVVLGYGWVGSSSTWIDDV